MTLICLYTFTYKKISIIKMCPDFNLMLKHFSLHVIIMT